jgi:hypothetical protein
MAADMNKASKPCNVYLFTLFAEGQSPIAQKTKRMKATSIAKVTVFGSMLVLKTMPIAWQS